MSASASTLRCWVATLCWSCWAPAQALQLIEPPQGLAWSQTEVDAAGAAAADAVLKQAGATGCRSDCELIAEVWGRLSALIREQEAQAAQPHRLRLVVVQDAGIEAFAVPDGRIVLGENFVRERRLDAPQLAFVLAHEATHVLLEHERQTLTSALALLPRNVPRTVDDVYVELDFHHSIARLLEPVYQQAEYEADEIGFELAALAGYAPDEQIRFMAGEAARGDDADGGIRTHPPASARLERLRRELPLARRIHERAIEDSMVESP